MLDKCYVKTKEFTFLTCPIYNGQTVKITSEHVNSIYLPFVLQGWFVVLNNYDDFKAQIKLRVKQPLLKCKN